MSSSRGAEPSRGTRPRRTTAALATVRAGLAVARWPSLWPTALRQAARLRAPGRLTPSPAYLAFRMTTQYGDAGARPTHADIVGYLRWCRHWRSLQR